MDTIALDDLPVIMIKAGITLYQPAPEKNKSLFFLNHESASYLSSTHDSCSYSECITSTILYLIDITDYRYSKFKLSRLSDKCLSFQELLSYVKTNLSYIFNGFLMYMFDNYELCLFASNHLIEKIEVMKNLELNEWYDRYQNDKDKLYQYLIRYDHVSSVSMKHNFYNNS